MSDEVLSEVGPNGTFESYRAEGQRLEANGEYNKAILSYTTALDLVPGEVTCLIARSQTYLKIGDCEKALEDAEASIVDDQSFHKGIYAKAEALYSKGKFEKALVFYSRGSVLRPELKEFKLGISKAEEAIDNSVGKIANIQLTKEGDLSFFSVLEEQRKTSLKKYGKPKRVQTTTKKYTQSTLKDKSVKTLLGELYGDKVFLENFLQENDTNTTSGKKMHALCKEAIDYLDHREHFWGQQMPLYARKKDKTSKRNNSHISETNINERIIKELEKIYEDQDKGNYAKSLRDAKKCLTSIEKSSNISNREQLLGTFYSLMGYAHGELKEFNKAMSMHKKCLKIAAQKKFKDLEAKAYHAMGRVHTHKGEYAKAIECLKKKLDMSESMLENTWLNYEIGLCYYKLASYEYAMSHAEVSLKGAVEIDDNKWKTNATILKARIEDQISRKQTNTEGIVFANSALETYREALKMAKHQGDPDVEMAIQKEIIGINERICIYMRREENQQEQKNERLETHESTESGEEKEEENQQEQKIEQLETHESTESGEEKEAIYVITVNTGEKWGSGTDASVYVEIFGSKDKKTGTIWLKGSETHENPFESGNKDRFTTTSLDVGEINMIRIGHDRAGACSGWFLDSVEVENEASNTHLIFKCDRWLDVDEGDGLTERDLTLEIPSKIVSASSSSPVQAPNSNSRSNSSSSSNSDG